jgi:hypothetical protein
MPTRHALSGNCDSSSSAGFIAFAALGVGAGVANAATVDHGNPRDYAVAACSASIHRPMVGDRFSRMMIV